MNTPKLLLFFLLLTVSSIVSAQKIEEKNIKTHIKFLANDALQGRQTGSAGERMALDYIEKQFKVLKLQPKGESDSFEQTFSFKSGVHGTGTEGTAHNQNVKYPPFCQYSQKAKLLSFLLLLFLIDALLLKICRLMKLILIDFL